MSTASVLDTVPAAPTAIRHRKGELAILLQEAFTAAARLRANRQVAQDAASFRAQTKHLLGIADQEARRAGYDGRLVKLAIYAYIAFLDESVLNSAHPMFSAWSRQPLQEEIFGDHMAGQTFFTKLDELLGEDDSGDLADLLEVYLLCLLLGFRGRYASGEDGGLRDRISRTQARIARIRGEVGEIAPDAYLPKDETLPERSDPWLKRLLITTAALLILTVALFIVFRASLGSSVDSLRTLAEGIAA